MSRPSLTPRLENTRLILDIMHFISAVLPFDTIIKGKYFEFDVFKTCGFFILIDYQIIIPFYIVCSQNECIISCKMSAIVLFSTIKHVSFISECLRVLRVNI